MNVNLHAIIFILVVNVSEMNRQRNMIKKYKRNVVNILK
jgi:hypothetical protein